ncbi:MAG: hypothetical protein IT381_07250 [Deltaproteobacteria bacterium]|nr:hypothetical protein [Deltaproteobacteria bacterium]
MKIQGKQTVSEQRALSDVKAKLEQLIENTPAKGGSRARLLRHRARALRQ